MLGKINIKINENAFLVLQKNHKNEKQIFLMRNNKFNYKFSKSKKIIKYLEHKIWLINFFKKKNILYLVYYKSLLCGYFRLEKKNKVYEISIYIDAKFRKKNIGSDILNHFNSIKKKNCFLARVYRQNYQSINFFQKNGFSIISKTKKLIIL